MRAEIVVERDCEFLAQAKHLAEERPGSPEGSDNVENLVEVPSDVASDDGHQRGELREHELAQAVLARAHHLQNNRHRRREVLHARQTQRAEDEHDRANHHVMV